MKVRKNPSAQRASKAPFLMEIIWSILRSAFCQDEKCSDRLCTASRPFFLEQRRIEFCLRTSRVAFRTRATFVKKSP